ncbi:dihydrofolate reductase family protein [Cryptosporangium minutisporangium]|uniref:Dihydrofolate reductase family protein n=1 Tax=Cryptosporangium minutisporangium TaxID=113569 RepID=A0ABP6TAJ3_9ACTN
MGRLIESTFVTIDGVISSPEVWGVPYWDEEHNAYSQRLLADADALLLGRETYEGFAEAWPSRSGDEYSDRINAMPKYVASRTLREATWNSTILEGDVGEAVAALKLETPGNLLKFGTGELDRTLIEHGLVDEFHLWLFPVVAGTGQRILDGLDVTHLTLSNTTRFGSGIIVLTYTPK